MMPTPRKVETRLRETHSHGLHFSIWIQSCPKLDPVPDSSITQANNFSILPKQIWVGFSITCHCKDLTYLRTTSNQSLWHTGYSRGKTGTPWEEKDIERMQRRDDWTCLSTSPEGCTGVLAAETQTSVMDDIFIPKPSSVIVVPWAGSFPVAVKQVLQEAVLKLFPNPQSWVTRGILLDIFIL